LAQFFSGLKLALCIDDFGPSFALNLGLARHTSAHSFWKHNVAHFNGDYLHPPRVGVLVYHHLQFSVDFVSVGQKLIQLRLADYAPQSGLGD
jgi:hypothetical protein